MLLTLPHRRTSPAAYAVSAIVVAIYMLSATAQASIVVVAEGEPGLATLVIGAKAAQAEVEVIETVAESCGSSAPAEILYLTPNVKDVLRPRTSLRATLLGGSHGGAAGGSTSSAGGGFAGQGQACCVHESVVVDLQGSPEGRVLLAHSVRLPDPPGNVLLRPPQFS